MNPLLAIILAPVIGAVLGAVAMVGIVSTQTSVPAQNPASQAALTYGQ